MKNILFAFWMLLVPAVVEAQETNESWILQMEFPRLLRDLVPQVQLGGSLGAVGTDKLGSSIMGRRSEIYTVQSSEGFTPGLIKSVLDKWLKEACSTVRSSSAGSQEVGFVSHDWAYSQTESGIVGRLTLWFPDTKAKPMKMVVVIDERKSRSAQPEPPPVGQSKTVSDGGFTWTLGAVTMNGTNVPLSNIAIRASTNHTSR